MANTFTSRLRLILQENQGNFLQWGILANTMVELIDSAIAGATSISLASSDVTLSATNNAADQSRSAILILTGAIGADREVVIPAVSKLYAVQNNTTGAQTVTVKTSAGVGAVVPQGVTTYVMCDGTDCFLMSVAEAANALRLGGVLADEWARLYVRQVFEGAQDVLGVSVAYSATIELDADEGNVFNIGLLTGALLLSNPINTASGQTIIVHLTQDGVGGRAVTFGTNWLFPGGAPTIVDDPNTKSSIYCSVDSDGLLRCSVANVYQTS